MPRVVLVFGVGVGVGVGVWCLVFAEYYLRSTMIFENARGDMTHKQL